MPRFLTPTEILDGHYSGIWGGHEIKFQYGGNDVYVHTERGVRGFNIPVTFQVVGNRVMEDTIDTQVQGSRDDERQEVIRKALRGVLRSSTLYQVLAAMADVIEESSKNSTSSDIPLIPDKIRRFRQELWRFVGSGD